MKYCTLILLLLTAIILSCKCPQTVKQVPVCTVERKITTMVPIYVPGDSAVLRAWFECDSLNNVLMKGIDERKSKNMSSDLSFSQGTMEYSVKTQPDTVYLPSDSVIIEKEIPVTVPIELEVNILTKWQTVRIRVGDMAMLFIAVFIAWKFIKLK